MIHITNKEKCCGCSACSTVCPKHCIEMVCDDEGFLYPVVNESSCVNCGLCNSVCPIETLSIENDRGVLDTYIVKNKNEKTLKESTSGGAFSAFAEYVLQKEGFVYGASIDDSFNVYHIGVDSVKDVGKFRNSKYLQSEVKPAIYRTIKEQLVDGKIVLFSGTPCQIAALKKFLKIDYSNLFTIDVVCRAVPSKKVFLKYIEFMENKKHDKIKTIRFRDKAFGYNFSTMTLVWDKKKNNYHHGIESDPWLRAFFSNICDRPSCHHCAFRTKNRNSDITIWDCFRAKKYTNKLNPKFGASSIAIHSEKGLLLFEYSKQYLQYDKIESNLLLNGCREYFQSVPKNKKREDFFLDVNRLSGEELFAKYFPITLKHNFLFYVRRIAVKFKIDHLLRKFYRKR